MTIKWLERISYIVACCAACIAGMLAGRGCFDQRPQVPPMPQEPPKPDSPTPPPEPKPDAWNAIGRISIGSTGCSATVIGKRRDDGRYWILTAAHCTSSVGAKGVMRFRDGRNISFTVQAIDRRADAAWLLSDFTPYDLPFAILADKAPAVGSKIWHGGYGVDRPGNREDGEVLNGPDGNGQIGMRLSVSSGDSGGGICLNESNEVVSCVCCTSARGQTARVWGAGPDAIRALKPKQLATEEWIPLEIPIRKD